VQVLIDCMIGMVKCYTEARLDVNMYIFLEFPLSVSAEEPVNFTYNEQVTIITGPAMVARFMYHM